MLIGAILWALNAARPDVLVSEGGQAFAVRGPDGRLAILKRGSDAFAVREWLAADGDTRLPGDATLAQGFACDPVGCIARLRDGALAAIVLDPEAFQEDCARAKIVLTARSAPPSCRATLVDRTSLRQNGAVALRRTASGFELSAARPPSAIRPWTRPREQAVAAAPALPAAAQTSASQTATDLPAFGPDD